MVFAEPSLRLAITGVVAIHSSKFTCFTCTIHFRQYCDGFCALDNEQGSLTVS